MGVFGHVCEGFFWDVRVCVCVRARGVCVFGFVCVPVSKRCVCFDHLSLYLHRPLFWSLSVPSLGLCLLVSGSGSLSVGVWVWVFVSFA